VRWCQNPSSKHFASVGSIPAASSLLDNPILGLSLASVNVSGLKRVSQNGERPRPEPGTLAGGEYCNLRTARTCRPSRGRQEDRVIVSHGLLVEPVGAGDGHGFCGQTLSHRKRAIKVVEVGDHHPAVSGF
jgi:hypothetical protein